MKTLILFLLTMFSVNALSQTATPIEYKYDESGNRIIRQVVVLKSAKARLNDLEKEVFEDKQGDQTIRILPNPTRGLLQIEILGYTEEVKSALYLFNLTGKLIINKSPANSNQSIDLTNYPSGIYILKIVIGDKVSEWEIIKE